MEDDGSCVYGQLTYWSTDYFDVDLSSYGNNTISNSERSSRDRITEFICRHSDSLFQTSGHSTDVSSCIF